MSCSLKGTVIYDVGYGAFKSPDELIAKLKARGVEVLVDLRRSPTSRIKGFSKTPLKERLEENGIEYIWLGEWLGGFVDYAVYSKTSEYRLGLELITLTASEKAVCIMCLEPDRSQCHRRFIIADLEKMGFKVAEL